MNLTLLALGIFVALLGVNALMPGKPRNYNSQTDDREDHDDD